MAAVAEAEGVPGELGGRAPRIGGRWVRKVPWSSEELAWGPVEGEAPGDRAPARRVALSLVPERDPGRYSELHQTSGYLSVSSCPRSSEPRSPFSPPRQPDQPQSGPSTVSDCVFALHG